MMYCVVSSQREMCCQYPCDVSGRQAAGDTAPRPRGRWSVRREVRALSTLHATPLFFFSSSSSSSSSPFLFLFFPSLLCFHTNFSREQRTETKRNQGDEKPKASSGDDQAAAKDENDDAEMKEGEAGTGDGDDSATAKDSSTSAEDENDQAGNGTAKEEEKDEVKEKEEEEEKKEKTDWSSLRVVDLREELSKRDLDTKGKKADLIKRLEEAEA